MNDAAAKVLGYDRDALLGIPVHDIIHHSRPDGAPYPIGECPMIKTAREGKRARVDDELLFRKDGSSFPVEYSSNPVIRNGEVRGAVVTFQDISDRRRSEEQLRQTAKLESLGILAGGIAHDFNNLLTGILGNASLMFESAGVRDPNRELLQEILDATERAAKLTSQMLAYAGKGQFVIEPLNLANSVKEMTGLIASSVPKNVLVRYQLDERVPAIQADALQMHQIIMNLVINAGEAIGTQNGVVIVRTGLLERREIPAAPLMPADLPEGRYVFLEVSDTGPGIAPEVIGRIFDPFFSTKFTGRGLGLPAALGIVRAHNGAIQLESETRKGSRFTVYFPALTSSVPAGEIRQTHGSAPQGYETILVIDDEDVVRRTAANALAQFGYRVLLAEDGPEGIEQLRRHADSVALIVLDLTMPKMSGEEAARFLHASSPGAPIIISSGYDEREVRRHFTSHAIAGYIRKPYRADQLAEKIRSVLDARGSRGSSA
jgi:PAS domain S-box-containing protein